MKYTPRKIELYLRYLKGYDEVIQRLPETGYLTECEYDYEGEQKLVQMCEAGELLHTDSGFEKEQE